jgi:hypothetical protein
MEDYNSKKQLIEEIDLIPENKHKELYDLIHKFRMDLEQIPNNIDEIMQWAGSWSDMSESAFNDFCEEIEQRRQSFLSRRFAVDSSPKDKHFLS